MSWLEMHDLIKCQDRTFEEAREKTKPCMFQATKNKTVLWVGVVVWWPTWAFKIYSMQFMN